MANIFEQLAANHEFITRFKDDAKKAIQSLIDSGQIAADPNQVILLQHITSILNIILTDEAKLQSFRCQQALMQLVPKIHSEHELK